MASWDNATVLSSDRVIAVQTKLLMSYILNLCVAAGKILQVMVLVSSILS